MSTLSRPSYAVPAVAGALVVLCALALVRSYSSIPGEPLRVAIAHEKNSDEAGEGSPRSRQDAPLSARLFEEEDEANMLAERAEEAKEDQEELREEAEEESGLRTDRGRTGETLLRAHVQVISTRDTVTGAAPDPCVISVRLPPSMPHEGGPRVQTSLRATMLAADGADVEIRKLSEVATVASCTPAGGFYLADPGSVTRIQLCPTSCVWVRGAAHGVRMDVLAETP